MSPLSVAGLNRRPKIEGRSERRHSQLWSCSLAEPMKAWPGELCPRILVTIPPPPGSPTHPCLIPLFPRAGQQPAPRSQPQSDTPAGSHVSEHLSHTSIPSSPCPSWHRTVPPAPQVPTCLTCRTRPSTRCLR